MEDYNTINSFPRPNLPDGFRTLIYALSKEVLREQPPDLYGFCADFFGKRLVTRGDSWVSFKERYSFRKKEQQDTTGLVMPEEVTEDTSDLPLRKAVSKPSEEDAEAAEETEPTTPTEETPKEEPAASSTELSEEKQAAIVKIQAGIRGMLARKSLHDTSVPTTQGALAQELTEEELERWKHPQQQMELDLSTCASGIEFAELEDHSGTWEAGQRWLRPAMQLHRDFATGSEPVEFADIRDRTGSVMEVGWWEKYHRWSHPAEQLHRDMDTAAEGIDFGDKDRDRTFSVTDVELPPPPDPLVVAPPAPPGSPPEAVTPAHSHVDVAGQGEPPTEEAGRAGSPPEATTPAHSDIDLPSGAVPQGTPSRTTSVPSVASTQHSAVDLADAKTAPEQTERKPSLDSVNPEAAPQSDASSPPPEPPADITTAEGQKTASSQIDLAGEQPTGDPTDRAGSPPEVASPAHSDIDVPADAPAAEAERAGSPAEAASPAHSEVDVAQAPPTPTEEPPRPGSPPEAISPAHSDVDVATAADGIPEAGRAGSPPEAVTPAASHEEVPQPAPAEPTDPQPEENN